MHKHPNDAVCRTLQKMAAGLHVFKTRVEFLALAFKHNLADAITGYELWDKGYEGLGERQFDTCFEMGDSQDVIAELILRARAEGFIETIRAWCGEQTFERWCGYADRQASLF